MFKWEQSLQVNAQEVKQLCEDTNVEEQFLQHKDVDSISKEQPLRVIPCYYYKSETNDICPTLLSELTDIMSFHEMAPITRAMQLPAADHSDNEDENMTGPKFFNLHLYPKTNRWGAWVKEPRTGGKRIYLGTHTSKYLAARCQDRARLKIWTEEPIPLYFSRNDYDEDEHLRNSLNISDFVELLRSESRGTYKISDSSACLQKFMAEEVARGASPEGLLGIEPIDVAELPEELISEAFILQQLEHMSVWEVEELKSDPLLMLHFVAEVAASIL